MFCWDVAHETWTWPVIASVAALGKSGNGGASLRCCRPGPQHESRSTLGFVDLRFAVFRAGRFPGVILLFSGGQPFLLNTGWLLLAKDYLTIRF